MPKSKNRKGHKAKLSAYKAKKKQEQEKLRKVMYDEYIKTQEEHLASREEHKDSKEEEAEIDTGDFTIDE